MAKTISQLTQILATGASVTISSERKTATQLEELAAVAASAGGVLTITGCDRFTTSQMESIGVAGTQHVHLVL